VANSEFKLLVANLDYSDYLGRIALGKILGGKIAVGDSVACIHGDGRKDTSKVTAIFHFDGLARIQIEEAGAGDIIGLTGFEEVAIGETITDTVDRDPIPFVPIDPPTIVMQFAVNDGPLGGKDGKLVTARHIKERLMKEIRTNVSLKVADTDVPNIFEVSARGEMQIAILVEQMRREGFEVLVSRPEVIYHRNAEGNLLEPIEKVFVEFPKDNMGTILENLSNRKAEITHLEHHGEQIGIEAIMPMRGLIGFETDLVNQTRGLGVMSHLFHEYGPDRGDIAARQTGSLVSMESGVATAYALNAIQERGRLFIEPGEAIYPGMIVGENPRVGDIQVNPCKAKKLSNMRSVGDGKGIQLEPPMKMPLERALEYIGPDEYVEATPKNLRLRKKLLGETARKRAAANRFMKVVEA
jgi:GTP-binding protein